jgi:hypothetical protein
MEADMSVLKKVFKKVVQISSLGLVGGKKKEEVEEEPVELVSGDEEKIRLAKKKKITQLTSGSGRSSTIAGQGTSGFGG